MMTRSDLRTCRYCGTRILFPVTPEGKKMPPVNYGEDPVGTVAVHHKETGEYVGRFLAALEYPDAPEKRHALHWCDGLERQRQRGRWTSVQSQHARERRRRRTAPAQPELLPGMFRLPGREVTHDP